MFDFCQDEKSADNMVFATSGDTVLRRTVKCRNESLNLRRSFSADNPRLRKYPNRWQP